MADERICGHCREPMRGFASAGDAWLCHPDDGLDCYRMVTVYKHPLPCFPCASVHYDEQPPRRVRTQVERDADGVAWRYHEHGERISDGRPGLLPPVPDCCYPPDAVDLPEPRRRWWHRLTRRNP